MMAFGAKPGAKEEEIAKTWLTNRYHAPSDDLNQPVDLKAAGQYNRLMMTLAEAVANTRRGRSGRRIASSAGSRSDGGVGFQAPEPSVAIPISDVELRAGATIDSHRSNRIVPGWQSRMSFEGKTADLLWIG